jgi:3-oxoacyl-[acyl-carrier protein] reductase
LFIDSGSPARDTQRITTTAALPGLRTILAPVPKSEKQKRANSGTKAIKRLASLEDVTGALLLLTSDDAAFITGQAIVVDGAQNPVG